MPAGHRSPLAVNPGVRSGLHARKGRAVHTEGALLGLPSTQLPQDMATNGAQRTAAAHARGKEARCRVVVADDDVLLREGVASLLERTGFDVVGRAGDGGELIELVRRLKPDLVLVDIRMPPTHSVEGLEAARAIRRELPDTGIVVLSAHVEVEHAMELLESGRRTGYLLKGRVTDVDEFIETLDRIARGASVIDPALVQELVAARHRNDPLAELSSREREVLSLMAEGRSNAGIARRLFVTEGTVEKHVRSILSKLPIRATHDDHRRVLAVVAFLESR
jgi:DNA-binding NarL/FixJ family response regulator